MDDLDRLFQRLVHNIRNGHAEYLSVPFTVQELYDTLVPYRHYRRDLGIETNQDYEAALTRLLSGEKGDGVAARGRWSLSQLRRDENIPRTRRASETRSRDPFAKRRWLLDRTGGERQRRSRRRGYVVRRTRNFDNGRGCRMQILRGHFA